MLNVGVIGVGNCGNQIAAKAFTDINMDVFCINASENDLATLPQGITRRLIGDAEGTGKHREAAKGFLKDKIMELIRDDEFVGFMKDKDLIFVLGSTGGGTGSGIAPLLCEICSKSFVNKDGSPKVFVLLGVLPRLTEGLSTQVNTMAYLQEIGLNENLSYMLFDNNAASNSSTAKVLEEVNNEIIQVVRVLSCEYNISTKYDSIDEKDMKTLLMHGGRIATYSLLDLKEKDLDNVTIEDKFIEQIKNSVQVELERDGAVFGTGLITNLSEKLNEDLDSQIPKVREFVGEPVDEYLHIGVNAEKALPNNAFLILTGLSKPGDRIDRIRERIDEIESRRMQKKEVEIDTSEIQKFNEIRSNKSDNSDSTEIDLSAIFGKYNA